MNTSLDKRIFRKISAFGETRGEERRIAITKATIESLANIGIQSTTFDSVAKIAGMQRSHIAYYYKTREELIMTAVRFAIAMGQELTIESIKNAGTPLERISAIIRAFFLQIEKSPKHRQVWTLFWNLASMDPAYRILHTEIRQMGRDRLEHLLELHFQGEDVKRETLGFLARSIQAQAYGYFVEAAAMNSGLSFADAAELANEACLRLIRSFAKP